MFTFPLWVTRIVYLLCIAGALLSPEMFPNPLIYRWVQFVCGLAGALNHQVAANSNPDGTPARSAYEPLPPVR